MTLSTKLVYKKEVHAPHWPEIRSSSTWSERIAASFVCANVLHRVASVRILDRPDHILYANEFAPKYKFLN